MSVGFRPTEADNEIIKAHKRPEESTSDVLRRALRALDRQAWEEQARADMERIAASGEDLSDEPDDWGPTEDSQPGTAQEGVVPAVAQLPDSSRGVGRLYYNGSFSGAIALSDGEGWDVGEDEGGDIVYRQVESIDRTALQQRVRAALMARYGREHALRSGLLVTGNSSGTEHPSSLSHDPVALDVLPRLRASLPEDRPRSPGRLARLHAVAARRAGKR